MATLMKEGLNPHRRKHGLVNGEIYHFECNSCGKDLLDVQVTRPDYDIDGNYKCKCPYCGNFSNTHYIKGGTILIGHAEIDQNGHEVVKTMGTGAFNQLSDNTIVLEIIKL